MDRSKVTLEVGIGVLDVRALIASIVGPNRLPFGTKKSHALAADALQGTPIASNIGVADAVLLVGIARESGSNDDWEEGFPGILSKDQDNMGVTSSWPVFFFPSANSFPLTVVLLPGEQLFARVTVEDVRILVSEVQFR